MYLKEMTRTAIEVRVALSGRIVTGTDGVPQVKKYPLSMSLSRHTIPIVVHLLLYCHPVGHGNIYVCLFSASVFGEVWSSSREEPQQH